jgi:protein-disulfide isomerase
MPDAPPDLAVPVTDADHAQGPATAPVTLVEYGDYECPSCLNAEPIVSALRRKHGDKLRVVFRHFPQNSVHARASAAAEAAEAAAAQGKFWEMHRALYQHSQTLADVDLTHLALSNGLDVYKFGRDAGTGGFAKKVRNDYDGGRHSGVTGTPTFFINGQKYEGEATDLPAAIEAAIVGSIDG